MDTQNPNEIDEDEEFVPHGPVEIVLDKIHSVFPKQTEDFLNKVVDELEKVTPQWEQACDKAYAKIENAFEKIDDFLYKK